MRYFYIEDDNAVVRLNADGTMWLLKPGGVWEENYTYGGIFSGDIEYKEIDENQLSRYAK